MPRRSGWASGMCSTNSGSAATGRTRIRSKRASGVDPLGGRPCPPNLYRLITMSPVSLFTAPGRSVGAGRCAGHGDRSRPALRRSRPPRPRPPRPRPPGTYGDHVSQVADPHGPAGTTVRRARRRRPSRNAVLLWMVAAGYAGAQFALGMHRVFLGWDEVLYVSQFSKEMPPGFMDSPRAWGIPFIVALVAAVAASVETIRIYVISLLSVGVFGVFWAWLRVRDTAAVPLAALLLCCLWVSLFYGNAVMPNMVTALCTVAAVALFLQVSRGKRRQWGRGARRAVAGLAV